jgi:hypothetical protein
VTRAGLVFAVAVVAGCTTVRQLHDPSTLATDGRAIRTRADKALDYGVAVRITATPATIWSILIDTPAYTTWSSSIVRLRGQAKLGAKLELVSRDKPDKTFDLRVTTLDAPRHMVWEDGNWIFLGVRNFTLIPNADGTTTFAMSETLSGGMLGWIEGSLPDFRRSFEAFAADLKRAAEARTAMQANVDAHTSTLVTLNGNEP